MVRRPQRERAMLLRGKAPNGPGKSHQHSQTNVKGVLTLDENSRNRTTCCTACSKNAYDVVL